MAGPDLLCRAELPVLQAIAVRTAQLRALRLGSGTDNSGRECTGLLRRLCHSALSRVHRSLPRMRMQRRLLPARRPGAAAPVSAPAERDGRPGRDRLGSGTARVLPVRFWAVDECGERSSALADDLPPHLLTTRQTLPTLPPAQIGQTDRSFFGTTRLRTVIRPSGVPSHSPTRELLSM